MITTDWLITPGLVFVSAEQAGLYPASAGAVVDFIDVSAITSFELGLPEGGEEIMLDRFYAADLDDLAIVEHDMHEHLLGARGDVNMDGAVPLCVPAPITLAWTISGLTGQLFVAAGPMQPVHLQSFGWLMADASTLIPQLLNGRQHPRWPYVLTRRSVVEEGDSGGARHRHVRRHALETNERVLFPWKRQARDEIWAHQTRRSRSWQPRCWVLSCLCGPLHGQRARGGSQCEEARHRTCWWACSRSA